jgi:hypothetical protein
VGHTFELLLEYQAIIIVTVDNHDNFPMGR